MMTPEQWQALIAAELDQSANAEFTSYVAALWPAHDDKRLIHPRLQYLYVRVAAIDYLRGRYWKQYDVKEADVAESRNQLSLNLQRLRDDAQTEIKTLEAGRRAGRGGRTGTISRQAPISVQDVVDPPIEPSDRAYRGDPLRRSF